MQQQEPTGIFPLESGGGGLTTLAQPLACRPAWRLAHVEERAGRCCQECWERDGQQVTEVAPTASTTDTQGWVGLLVGCLPEAHAHLPPQHGSVIKAPYKGAWGSGVLTRCKQNKQRPLG